MQFNKTQPAVDSSQGENKLTGLEQGYSNLYRLPEKDPLPFALRYTQDPPDKQYGLCRVFPGNTPQTARKPGSHLKEKRMASHPPFLFPYLPGLLIWRLLLAPHGCSLRMHAPFA